MNLYPEISTAHFKKHLQILTASLNDVDIVIEGMNAKWYYNSKTTTLWFTSSCTAAMEVPISTILSQKRRGQPIKSQPR